MITVVSDSHGNYKDLENIFLRCNTSDWYIHLGDGEEDLDRFLLAHPEYGPKVIHVSGNCDAGSLSPYDFILPAPYGHKIFATHGHRYAVKNDLEILKRTAKINGCDIVLFGHTHVRYCKLEDGLYIMNPGSITAPHDGFPPSFGSIDFYGAEVLLNITDV